MPDNSTQKIPKRILASLLASVSAGVVPREGAPYIAIGRKDEIAAFLSDLELVNEGGGSMRFLVGRYGSGKSFLIQLIRGYALERGFLTADADLSPERRLYGSGGAGVATYRELMKNLASRSSPDGGALQKVIAKWIGGLRESCGGSAEKLSAAVRDELRGLEFLVGGFDFAKVILEYYAAAERGEDEKCAACLRWLRGEFTTKTEAKRELGFDVSTIISDSNWYDFIKLWAALSHKFGYRGLIVFIDECVNLYKIPNRVARENNYEKILSMFNDTCQGRAPYLEIVLGGTPQFLEDTRRGLYSYEALRSRLCDSRFQAVGVKNTVGPVLRLARLGDDELLALIVRMTALHSQYYGHPARITPEEQLEFLRICLSRAGADVMITPREMLRDYMTVLNILMQNPDKSFSDIVPAVTLAHDGAPSESTGTAADASGSEDASAHDGEKRAAFDPADIDF